MNKQDYTYQNNFSELHREAMYDDRERLKKANKVIAVLDDYFKGKLSQLTVLDIGCSTGFITKELSNSFLKIVGIDIDKKAVVFAQEQHQSNRVEFKVGDAMNLEFPDESFDIVICAHIYEHVPSSEKLMKEIYRVLKKGGVCFFAAGNRLILVESHYNLPLLSVIPKGLANFYLRILRIGKEYYENHLFHWELKQLVKDFSIVDYTIKTIADPKKYFINDLVRPGSIKQRFYLWITKNFYWLCPTYIWALVKE